MREQGSIRAQGRGFTLLEVMVAMAILALGLTIILSSQAGLFAATRRVQNETHAASLMRCKMSELEVDLLVDGFSLLEQTDSGECCEDEDEGDFRCEWTIQTIELPQPASFDKTGGDEDDSDAEMDDSTAGLGQVAGVLGGSALKDVGGVDDLAGTLGGAAEGAAEGGGIVGMALGMVYPTLKPMLEASIRKVKVAVIWDEGEKERRFEVTQYVTNPLEGSLNPNAAEGVEDALDQANSLLNGQTGAPGAADADSENSK